MAKEPTRYVVTHSDGRAYQTQVSPAYDPPAGSILSYVAGFYFVGMLLYTAPSWSLLIRDLVSLVLP